jgi:ABC-type branched-subunit amino acid transport system substrate-binding protein
LKEYKKSTSTPADQTVIASSSNVETYTALRVVAEAIGATLNNEEGNWMTKLKSSENLSNYRSALSLAIRNNGNPYATLMGPIQFDATGHNNQQPVLIQLIDGNLSIVFPPIYAEKSPVFIQGW